MAIKGPSLTKQSLTLLLPLLLWLFATSIQASPIADPLFGPVPVIIKPKFPSKSDCESKIKTVDKDKSMYFTGLKTRGEINTAKKYATDHGLIHVSSVYPDGYTDVNRYEGSDDEKRAFQEAFSQVYAEKTSGTAYLMLDDGQDPADTSIFKTIEFKAMKDGGHVDKILRFPYNNPPDDPKSSNSEFWKKDGASASYAKGWCGVHVTHYQIPDGDNKYYLQAELKDATGVQIGQLEKTDATNPVDVTSALPYVLIITADKPGSAEDVDGKPLHFAYAGTEWTSDDESHCKFGGYEDGNREGDCGFTC